MAASQVSLALAQANATEVRVHSQNRLDAQRVKHDYGVAAARVHGGFELTDYVIYRAGASYQKTQGRGDDFEEWAKGIVLSTMEASADVIRKFVNG